MPACLWGQLKPQFVGYGKALVSVLFVAIVSGLIWAWASEYLPLPQTASDVEAPPQNYPIAEHPHFSPVATDSTETVLHDNSGAAVFVRIKPKETSDDRVEIRFDGQTEISLWAKSQQVFTHDFSMRQGSYSVPLRLELIKQDDAVEGRIIRVVEFTTKLVSDRS